MQAEEQFSRVILRIMNSVSSAEFYRILRHALAMSERHQQKLMGNFGAVAGTGLENMPDELDEQINMIARARYQATIRDLSYSSLITKIIQRKIDCYEQVLSAIDGQQLTDQKRILGAALSDEAATELFLQELSERIFLREFPERAFLA